MDIRYVDHSGIRVRELEDRTGSGTGGFVWVDIPEWSAEAEDYLRELGCHEMVLEACRTRNHVPTVHALLGPRVHHHAVTAARSRPATCTCSSSTRSSGATTW